MRKIKEVLRLKFELGLGLRQIARSCSIGLGTVHEYLQRAEAAGVTWPLAGRLGRRAGGSRAVRRCRHGQRPTRAGHAGLRRHSRAAAATPRIVTLQLLWEEYRQANPDGYATAASASCISAGVGKQDVVLRQEHKAGEKMFVDWAGATIPIHDRSGGPAQAGASVRGGARRQFLHLRRGHARSSRWKLDRRAHAGLRVLQGVPKLVVPDNTKTGVTKACRYDPDLNPTYQEMAMHYGVGVVPARPYKPRDKAKVEIGVQLAERWIMAALRHRKFFSLEELNQAIRELLRKLNQRPFRKRDGSRAQSVRSTRQTGAESAARRTVSI